MSLLAVLLAGCASAVTELPDGRGERNVSAYPAVHDLPPNRGEKALSEEEQVKLHQDLTAAGQSLPAKVEELERADAKPAPPPAKPGSKPAAKPAQAVPADPRQPPGRQAAGTRPNP